ncbi:MAG TPA: hypothetical protein VEP66_12255 [Myxococcales bacterium]|nr:hypothetical protein [Myxococcales bacterium]
MMRRSHLRASIPIAVLLLATAATAAPHKDPPALQVPIVGSASNGAAFAGTLSILRFEARANQVVAIGIVRGTVAAGTAVVGEVALPVQVTAASQAAPASSSSALVAQPQVAPQQTATCTALNLNLGAVNLNVLGLLVTTQPIAIDLSGDSSAPVGNLVCTALDLLNNVVGLVGILNQILGALTGLVGGLVP